MVINLRKHSTAALTYFFIISILGLILRLFYVTSVPLYYDYILHAHSHTAMLGWIYLGLIILIYKLFLKGTIKAKKYNWLLVLSNTSFLGMLVSFLLQGYGLYSISFSVLYLFSSYWLTHFILKHTPKKLKSRFSWKLIKAALFYLVLSSVGTWAVGPISATAGTDSLWFNDALYFFLHFLYSGFFFLVLIAVLFYVMEQKGRTFSKHTLDNFYVALNKGVFLSFFLSVLWTKPPIIFYLLGGIGAIYQVYGYFLLFKILKKHKAFIEHYFKRFFYRLLQVAAVLLMLRLFMQLISSVPYFAELAFKFQDFIIGYLHMVFLGVVTPTLLIMLHRFKLISLPKKAVVLYMVAFLTTELMIFYLGFVKWLKLPVFKNYFLFLAVLSLLYPISIGWLWIRSIKFAFTSNRIHHSDQS